MRKIIPLLCTVMIFSGMSFTANAVGENKFDETSSTTMQTTEYGNQADEELSEESTSESTTVDIGSETYSENKEEIQTSDENNNLGLESSEASTGEVLTEESVTESTDLENEEDDENDTVGKKWFDRTKRDKDEEESSVMDSVLKIFLFVLGGVTGASIMYAVLSVKINNIKSSLKSGNKKNMKEAEEYIEGINSILNDCNVMLEKNIVSYVDSAKDKFIDVSQKIGNIKYTIDDTGNDGL